MMLAMIVLYGVFIYMYSAVVQCTWKLIGLAC